MITERGHALSLAEVEVTYAQRGASPLFTSMSLSVDCGKIVCLAGRSGSGKTSALRVAHGRLRPTRGVVEWDGEALVYTDEPGLSRRRNVYTGFVDQSATLLPGLTVMENILLPAVPTGQAGTLRRHARALLDDLGLGDLSQAKSQSLSGGEAQRAALARAAIMSPRLLIADEPTANLDEANAVVVVDILRRYADGGRAVLIATHDPLVLSAADVVHTMTEVDQDRLPERAAGAGGGSRTHTPLRATEFESVASAIPPHRRTALDDTAEAKRSLL